MGEPAGCTSTIGVPPKQAGGPGHMASPACRIPRAGPGQWSPPPLPHLVCWGWAAPGQTSTDQRRTPVASGWQALPLDYRRGLTLPLPPLPLRVAPEHPGKPPESARPRPQAEGQTGRARAQGPAGVRGAGRAEGSCCLPDLARCPAGPCRLGARWDTALPQSRPRSLACPNLLGGERVPQGQPHALRLEAPQGTYEMLEAWPVGAA